VISYFVSCLNNPGDEGLGWFESEPEKYLKLEDRKVFLYLMKDALV
jgi:hypothetical protein